MIIHKNKGLLTVIWTPFKNYSTSLHRCLVKRSDFIGVNGKHPYKFEKQGVEDFSNVVDKHTNACNMIWGMKNSRQILPIRNPYNRTISNYHYVKKKNLIPESYTMLDFLYSKAHLHFPVVELYQYTHLVHVENIVEEFKILGIDISDIEHHNKGDYTEYKLSEKEKELIYFWHYTDFIAGGYAQ